MAVIAYAVTEIEEFGAKAHIVTWASMANGDTGTPLVMPGSYIRSVQVEGTFGVGGNVRIEGSNQATPSTYRPLNDPQGNALDFTAAKIEEIQEHVGAIRPNITAGDGTTSLTVSMFLMRRG